MFIIRLRVRTLSIFIAQQKSCTVVGSKLGGARHLVVSPLLVLNTDKLWTVVMFNSFLKYARCLQFRPS